MSWIRFRSVSMASEAYRSFQVRARDAGVKIISAPTHFGRELCVAKRGDAAVAFCIDPNVSLRGGIESPGPEQLRIIEDLKKIGVLQQATGTRK